jgi:hypothetical protein
VVGSDEANRHFAVFVCPSAEVLLSVNVAEILRNVVVEDFRIILLDDSGECR